MRLLGKCIVGSLSAIMLLPLTPITPAPITGFTAARARAEREWEARFGSIPDPAHMREAMRHLSARPHHVGSPYDRANAEWLRDQFQSYGWDATIETFDVLFPTPVERVVELVAPRRVTARLAEPALSVDPTSAQGAEQLPPYNAYSIDGDVTAPLVYVNHGVPADYDELERAGVSVKGAIVIARYGGSWRGIKPKVAAEHGAVGCIIYSDPRDDGYGEGAVFPDGPFRPAAGVQRGSVADIPVYPGDPLTPGVAATKDARRLALKDATTLTRIPVLPISYGDAQPLLEALGGRMAPESWRGGLPLSYRLGPGAAVVHLKVRSDWSTRPIYDVVARLAGSTDADQWVIRGNHHDAWVNGAEDPISGLTALLEEARAMGELHKAGWTPSRTIIYTAWDGEEPGLLGSTEWVEAHERELAAHAVAYINSDANGRGFLSAEGSHVLEGFINDVSRDVTDPETGVSVWKRLQASAVRWGSADDRRKSRDGRDLPIGALGSGSDFTPFLQHAGVATLNLGFGGEDGGGIYHSAYDDFYWFTHFSDTSFVYGRALAQTAGIAVMRMADADLLPYRFSNLASTVKIYVGELEKLADARAEEATERNRQLADSVFALTSDPRTPTSAPARLAVVPHLDFAPLLNATDSLARAAARYDSALSRVTEDGGLVAAASALHTVNGMLVGSERKLLAAEGLPKRPWYRHLLYAPGLYTGYGVKTVPGVREAIEQDRAAEADTEIRRVAAALEAEAALVATAAAALHR